MWFIFYSQVLVSHRRWLLYLMLILSCLWVVGCSSSDSDNTPNNLQQNLSMSTVDISNKTLSNRSANCADYVNNYASEAKDIKRNLIFAGSLRIELQDGKCSFSSNAIPNHDFNDGNSQFATDTSEQSLQKQVVANPQMATANTALNLSYDNAIFLNGVKLDLLSAGCEGVGDGKIGCHDVEQPFRFDPMSELTNFGTDSHNAHTQPNGEYHYHGNPMALFDQDDSSTPSPVIGFAADGFPIYGKYFKSSTGTVRIARSSYRLKTATRNPVSYNGETFTPHSSSYDGRYIDDFEYVAGLGDLDECNGMSIDGQYGYYVTDSYPWVLACFKGTPDESFSKR